MRRGLLFLLALLLALVFLPRILSLAGLAEPDTIALPPPGRNVGIADGLTVAVTDQGVGSPVVLVHGLPSCAADWGAVPERLASLGHRVVSYDRVGFGYSSRPDGDGDRYTFASSARDLRALLDALGIPSATLVGWSYGGGVVQRLAAEEPGRVDGLVLLASVGPTPLPQGSPLDAIVATPFAVPLLEWLSGVPPLGAKMTHDGVVEAFSGEPAVPPGWTERTGAMLRLPGTVRSLVLELQRLDQASLQPASLRVPTLILHGSDDRNVPLAAGEALHAAIPGSELVAVPDGSHMLPATHPDLVAAQIHRLVAALK